MIISKCENSIRVYFPKIYERKRERGDVHVCKYLMPI